MLRKFTFMIALILITLLAAACGDTTDGGNVNSVEQRGAGGSEVDSDTETGNAEATSELDKAVQSVLIDKSEVSITFWTGTGAANYPYLEAMVSAFQEEYPNIQVDMSNQGPIGELTDKLTQNIVSRSTPTLSNIDASTFPEYIASGAIIDLLPYYEHETIGLANGDEGIFPYYLEEVKSYGPPGTMYGFPTNKKTADVLVYNKTYFDSKGWEPPRTWDEVVQYSQTIYEETGMPGFSYDNSYGDAAFMLMSQQWGSPYIHEDGTIDILNDASREAMQFYKDQVDAGLFTMPALMPSGGGKFSSAGFVMEEAYMFVGAAAGVQFAIPNPESGHKDFEIGVAPVPQKDPSHTIYFAKGEDYVIFNNATEEQRVAAWLLIAFMSRAEQNIDWLINTGNLPISQAMLEVPEYKEFLNQQPSDNPSYYKAAAVNAVLSAGDLSFTRAIPESATLAQAVGEMWEAVMIGGGDVDQQLEIAASKVQ